MASQGFGSKTPITVRKTRKRTAAADGRQALPSASTAASTTATTPATCVPAPMSRCSYATPEPDADALLQMLSGSATALSTAACSPQPGPLSPGADEERPARSYGRSTGSRGFLKRSRSTGAISATEQKQRAEEDAEALKKLNEIANAPSVLSPSPHPGRRRCGGTRTVGLLVVLLGLAVFAVALALLLPAQKATGSADAGVCSTVGCVDHAEILGLHRNVGSVGPCQDFGEFVCSRWTEKNFYEMPSMTIFRMGKWLLDLAQTRWYDQTGQPEALRVTRLADACMRHENPSGSYTDSVEQLFRFMTEELFPWILSNGTAGDALPGDVDYAFTLATVVNLSVVWHVPLWFTVDLVQPWPRRRDATDPANRSVSVSASNVAYISMRLHREVETYKLYKTYVALLLNDIFRGAQLDPAFRSFLEDRSGAVQHDVFGNLSSVFIASHAEPRFLRMRHLPKLVYKLRARDWVDTLQSAFGENPPLGEDDAFFATDAALLRAVDDLFRSYTARDITFHTAWWFTQLMSTVSSDTMHAFVLGNKVGEEVYPVICGFHIAMAYDVLLSGIDRHTRTASGDQRSPVMRLLGDVHKTALRKVRSWTDALDSGAINAVGSRLGSASVVLWPERRRSENGSAHWWGEPLYGPDYDNATHGFFDHWREGRLRLRASLNSEPYQRSLRVFRIQSAYLATYDAVSNAISIGVQPVTQPFYATDGTSAMNYGGLGFLYALQLVRTINTLTVLLDGKTTPSLWVPRASSAGAATGQALWNLSRCASSNTSGYQRTTSPSLYPLLPALEIAHDAYRRFRDVTHDVPLRGLEAYSAEQVFFLTACRVTCWQQISRRLVSPECSEAFSNFAPFAEAFGCPAGTPMNRRGSCRFF
ncbi:hypothetical protein HPB50_015120 [Hyalomma asiaticum]|uniref:Uncharacterized protein n=1 Tax=Hyalomma asiaticum TaxID=266040 RepID=A0ACB7T2S5_HYAAI|nr:hypothetical protein HPB50_015120 [Hyalomma asiaticum]